MRTVEQIDADIVQAERSMGFYVDYASQHESSVTSMLAELSRVREEKQKIERLRAERKSVDQEAERVFNIWFGYVFTAIGLALIASGILALAWSTATARDTVLGACFFLALGTLIAGAGFGSAQRAHANKPAST